MEFKFIGFPIEVMTSKSQRAKKTTEKKLVDGEFVDVTIITNEDKVGVPKFAKLSGNGILGTPWLMKVAKITMENYARRVVAATYEEVHKGKRYSEITPHTIEYTFGLPKNFGNIKVTWDNEAKAIVYKASKTKVNWDLSNLAFFWIKAIEDSLVKERMLLNDTVEWIGAYTVTWEEVPTIEDRFIKVKIK